MSGDLTRWNRAGLSRFRYVDGNAVTFLETLRAHLAEGYLAPGETVPRWSDLVTRHPVPDVEDAAAREARLLAQYADERRDHGWEILRAFARSTHVLTEHIDAYANETFIGTATQWDSLRHLIKLLDARPAPPASARTDLAFDAAEAGTLSKGFQVKAAGPTDGPPPVFETVADLDMDPALNALYPTDWNRSQEVFAYGSALGGHVGSFPLSDPGLSPVIGEIAVLEIAPQTESGAPEAYGVQINPGIDGHVMLQGQSPAGGADLAAKRWRVALHADAELVQTPRLAGPDVVILTPEHNLAAGRSTVTWLSGGTWRTGRVMEIDGDRVRLDASVYPGVGDDLYAMVEARSQVLQSTETLVLPTERGASGRVWSAGLTDRTDDVDTKTSNDDLGNPFDEYDFIAGLATALYVPGGSDPVARVEVAAPTGLVLGGTVEGLRQGDWIVSAGATLQAVRVDAVTERDGDTAIDTTPAVADLQAPVHLKFAQSFHPLDHDRNRLPIHDTAALSDKVTRILTDADASDLLKRGRQVIVEAPFLTHSGEITATGPGWIEVAPVIPGTELTDPTDIAPLERWSTTISANVVTADHGETQTLKIIGSGDAVKSNQSFEIKAQELSFVTDPAMPSGVRAGVELFVGTRRWQQVGNLRDSGPTDAEYEIRVAEDGTVTAHFGDGRNGRRLPTGTDNVRATWRKGVGPSGNVDAGTLRKIVQPDQILAAARQPIPAAGGAETEGVESLRDNAAAGLLTLGRAVSVSDYGKLATQNAQVLQAVSYSAASPAARGELVEVVVVPAGGRMGTLGDDLTRFLDAHGLPGVTVQVVPYVPLPLSLSISIEVQSASYDPDAVAEAVRARIVTDFALERMRLGRPLFRSQILNAIEAIEGVENARAEILIAGWATITPPPLVRTGLGSEVRSVRPRPHQMIHHDPELSDLTVTPQEFTL